MRACGADAILVGEALMRSSDIVRHAAELKLLVRPGDDEEAALDHHRFDGAMSGEEA